MRRHRGLGLGLAHHGALFPIGRASLPEPCDLSLMGRMLQDFMPEHTDRERFDERMMGADEAAEHAAVSHTKLRDAVGGTIDMELFSVAFKGADDRRRYVPGMREFTNIQPMAELPRLAATRARQPKECPSHAEWARHASIT
mmetsp:Transcript_107011/g.335589  ORF Transcript_107011/g.335589 Transcript_107011/m.335589 type:complete len:142 (-) Transcript_107011:239-664(-)